MQPAVFIGHGSPTKILENDNYHKNLNAFAKSHDIPDSIVVLSAHWQKQKPVEITSAIKPGIIFDYYGFPKEMYSIKYDVEGNPGLAARLQQKFREKRVETQLNSQQGLDHGAWIPIAIMFPEANVSVVQISIPYPRTPQNLGYIGEVLSPLRAENIMIIGSGNITHNIGFAQQSIMQYGWDNTIPLANWAVSFDRWIEEALNEQKYEKIIEKTYQHPEFNLAAPTTEHLDPLFFTVGCFQQNEGVKTIHEGIEFGSVSMRCLTSQI